MNDSKVLPVERLPLKYRPYQHTEYQWLSEWSASQHFATVTFGTEGGLFDEAGIVTLVCGPGSMDQEHQPDEFFSIEQLDRCSAMLDNLRHWMST